MLLNPLSQTGVAAAPKSSPMTDSAPAPASGKARTASFPKPVVVAALVVLAATVVAGFTFNWGQPPSKDSKDANLVTVKRGRALLTVMATGLIRPEREVKISPKQSGLLMQLLVKQGDHVKAGQVLAVMDDSNLVGEVEAARGTYLQAVDNFQKMKAGNRPQEVAQSRFQEQKAEQAVRQATKNISRLQAQSEALSAQLQRDEAFAQRQGMLSRAGAVSDQAQIDADTAARVTRAQLQAAVREREQAEMALEQSRRDLDTSHQQRSLLVSGFRKEEIAAAEHNAMQALGNLNHMQSLLNDTKLRAPFDGIITQKYTDAGAIVTPTTSAATTSATSSSVVALAGRLEMVAQVSESNIARIKIGQPVEITATAYPGRVFRGAVTQIAPAAIVTQNVTTFEVHTDIAGDANGELLAGMNVSAKFIAGAIEDALTVPTVSVISRRGETGVYVPNEKGEPKFKAIQAGTTVGRDIVVLSGLQAGDKVFLGLSREQLTKEGYGGRGDRNRGGPGGGLGMPGAGRGMGGGGRRGGF